MAPTPVSDTSNIKFLLAIIDSLGGISGVKWGDVNEKLGGEKTNSALRKTFLRIKEKVEKEQATGADGYAVKPAAAKTKSPAKKRKIEEAEDEDADDGAE
jgi:hypothetical protein